ncbi:lipoprotein [Stenotrophomonas sp. 278]|uniref:LPS translocon maturation chaperone LptM n=1 Tax=Stenotrophomonas sp. 278 TaxID=2479851 RepID=UPI000F678AB9|nr:lipoprotein [Stenotrophomonas sp. 278]RRU16716.1 sugar transporter [Stenotrophomonas sp. 278]
MSIPHPRILLIPLAALALLSLSACGNKGPLVMPQKPVPVEEQAVEPVEDTVPADTDATDDPPVVPDPVEPQLDDDDGDE